MRQTRETRCTPENATEAPSFIDPALVTAEPTKPPSEIWDLCPIARLRQSELGMERGCNHGVQGETQPVSSWLLRIPLVSTMQLLADSTRTCICAIPLLAVYPEALSLQRNTVVFSHNHFPESMVPGALVHPKSCSKSASFSYPSIRL